MSFVCAKFTVGTKGQMSKTWRRDEGCAFTLSLYFNHDALCFTDGVGGFKPQLLNNLTL